MLLHLIVFLWWYNKNTSKLNEFNFISFILILVMVSWIFLSFMINFVYWMSYLITQSNLTIINLI